MPANGGEAKQLTSEADRVFTAGPVAWSPDGTSLAFFSRDNDDSDLGTIKTIPADGGEPRVVAEVRHIFANKELAWSPDGSRIAFNAFRPGTGKIFADTLHGLPVPLAQVDFRNIPLCTQDIIHDRCNALRVVVGEFFDT